VEQLDAPGGGESQRLVELSRSTPGQRQSSRRGTLAATAEEPLDPRCHPVRQLQSDHVPPLGHDLHLGPRNALPPRLRIRRRQQPIPRPPTRRASDSSPTGGRTERPPSRRSVNPVIGSACRNAAGTALLALRVLGAISCPQQPTTGERPRPDSMALSPVEGVRGRLSHSPNRIAL
jgi:hypothetical protein